MNNNLENFINNNREEFDSEEMKQGWEKIESKLQPKKGILRSINFFIAAAVVMVIGIITTVFISVNKKDKDLITPAQTAEVKSNSADAYDSAYSNRMTQFFQLIQQKQIELKEVGKVEPELYQQFIKDLTKLDSSFGNLKHALPANPNKEVLIEAMIKNLQIQIDLLNRQLQIINQVKQKNTEYESKTI